MTGEEVKKMRDEELKVELGRLRVKLYDLRSQTVTDKVGDTSQFIKIRKDVARLLTERRARQIAKAGGRAPKAKPQPVAAPAKKAAPRPTAKADGGSKARRGKKPGAAPKAPAKKKAPAKA